MTVWAIAFLAASLLLSGAFFAVCFARFHLVKQRRYSPLSDFPYEVFGDDFARKALRPLLGVVETAVSVPFVLFAFDERFSSLRGFSFALLGVAAVRGACYFLLFLVPVDHLRGHLLLASGSILSSVLLDAMCGIAFRDLSSFGKAGDVFFIAFLILAILSALPIFNPRLSHWADMKTVENEDGTSYLTRPKVFPLAATEWLSVLLSFLTTVCFLVGALVVALSL